MSILILVLCLLDAPTECREVQPSLEKMSLQECMIAGQVEGAKWVNEHPQYRFAGSRCQIGERPRKA